MSARVPQRAAARWRNRLRVSCTPRAGESCSTGRARAWRIAAGLALCLSASACTTLRAELPAAATPAQAHTQASADAFLAALAMHCGQAYAGRIVANVPARDAPPPAAPDPFEGKALVMHVRGCDDPTRGLRVPFHVGDDHSRTWVLTRTAAGLRLKHDHRHADGSPDALTQYGGDTQAPGTAIRQEFPVDAESIALFARQGSAASVTNTWAMEVVPGQRFAYELSRPTGRRFRVEFDLSRPVATPPAPWGAAD